MLLVLQEAFFFSIRRYFPDCRRCGLNDKDGNTIGTGSITVDGTGDGTTAVTAPMVDVPSGTFGISDGVTLSGNVNTSTGKWWSC